MIWFGYSGDAGGPIPGISQPEAFRQKQEHEKQQMQATLVAISEDPRESELLTLFRSADERGKHCMLAMARAMPCMRGNT